MFLVAWCFEYPIQCFFAVLDVFIEILKVYRHQNPTMSMCINSRMSESLWTKEENMAFECLLEMQFVHTSYGFQKWGSPFTRFPLIISCEV